MKKNCKKIKVQVERNLGLKLKVRIKGLTMQFRFIKLEGEKGISTISNLKK